MDLDAAALNGVVAVVLGWLVAQRRRRGWIHRQPLASLALALLARADLIFMFYFLIVCFLYFDWKLDVATNFGPDNVILKRHLIARQLIRVSKP
jgi:hypothetical protein